MFLRIAKHTITAPLRIRCFHPILLTLSSLMTTTFFRVPLCWFFGYVMFFITKALRLSLIGDFPHSILFDLFLGTFFGFGSFLTLDTFLTFTCHFHYANNLYSYRIPLGYEKPVRVVDGCFISDMRMTHGYTQVYSRDYPAFQLFILQYGTRLWSVQFSYVYLKFLTALLFSFFHTPYAQFFHSHESARSVHKFKVIDLNYDFKTWLIRMERVPAVLWFPLNDPVRIDIIARVRDVFIRDPCALASQMLHNKIMHALNGNSIYSHFITEIDICLSIFEQKESIRVGPLPDDLKLHYKTLAWKISNMIDAAPVLRLSGLTDGHLDALQRAHNRAMHLANGNILRNPPIPQPVYDDLDTTLDLLNNPITIFYTILLLLDSRSIANMILIPLIFAFLSSLS
jgi:hypothetical protein